MRIIGGKYKGKKLQMQVNSVTRPTSDKAREAIFSVIAQDILGARVLDLFAGTGAYGLEAHSRGASEVVFVDHDKCAIKFINANCASLGLKATVICADYKEALLKLSARQFDLIFIDPPYNSDFASVAIEEIISSNMLSENGVIIFETDVAISHEFLALYNVVKEKKYGRARVYFIVACVV